MEDRRPIKELLANVVDTAIDSFAMDVTPSTSDTTGLDSVSSFVGSKRGASGLALDRDKSLKHIQQLSPELFMKLKEQQEQTAVVGRRTPRSSKEGILNMGNDSPGSDRSRSLSMLNKPKPVG
jgi:hypothetical protein